MIVSLPLDRWTAGPLDRGAAASRRRGAAGQYYPLVARTASPAAAVHKPPRRSQPTGFPEFLI
jgi:hypothetical protein